MVDNSDDNSTPSKEPVKVSPESNILTYTPSDNVLMDYVSYTYNLSLIALSPDEYNKLILDKSSDPTAIYKPRNVIIAGAGRRDGTMPRNEHFNEDFYFDDFKMTTVIGMTTRTRMTNAIDISFTILEPYGVTLLNRLVNMANSPGLNCPNHVALPYLIQLEFFGYDEGGLPTKIANMTKYIPIKIIAMKIKVSTKGATYQINAIPFNHIGYNDTTVHSPTNFQVEATTLKDFFSFSSTMSQDAVNTKEGVSDQQTAAKTLQEDTAKLYELREKRNKLDDYEYAARKPILDKEIAEQEKKVNSSKNMAQELSKRRIQVKSFVDGFNGWLAQQESMGLVNKANRIYVNITDPEMRDSEIVSPESLSSTTTPMDHNKSIKSDATPVSETAKEGPKQEARGMVVPAGTSTVDVITNAVLNSKYIRSQFTEKAYGDKISEDDAKKLATKMGQGVRWFKITTKVELSTEFDTKRGEYPCIVTYIVKPTTVFASYNPRAPKGVPSGFAKYYFYMFTGQNTNVLDFDIDYDAAYYMKLTADSLNAQPNLTDQKTNEDKKELQESQNNKTLSKTNDSYIANIRPTIVYTSPPVDASDSLGVATKDLANNIITSSKGDMIQLNLKILGDPDFIKQDDLFYMVTDDSTREAEHKTTNGSLIMDSGDIHAFVIFRTPVDYNGQGLAAPVDDSKGTAYSTSIFSGVYKILTVESNFKSGVFTQTLTLIRLMNQEISGLREWMIAKDVTGERTGKQDSALSSVDTNKNVLNADPSWTGRFGSVEKNTATAEFGVGSPGSGPSEEIPGLGTSSTSKSFNGSSVPGSPPVASDSYNAYVGSKMVNNTTEEFNKEFEDTKNWATRMID